MSDTARPQVRPGVGALVVMAKALVRGTVKARLAAAVDDDQALAIYERLLHGTLDQAEKVTGVGLVLAEAREGAGPAADSLAGRSAWARLEQRGRTLGERLAAVFTDLFEAGAHAVVVVNSDSPALPVEYLEQAFANLATATVSSPLVLGPAADGGYYLIGCSRRAWDEREAITTLLTSSPMSTASLLADTLRAAADRGLSIAQLPLWVDIDEPADLWVLERLDGDAPRRGEPLAALREIYIHLTHRCGRDCLHCYDKDAAREAGELSAAEWRDAVDQCVALGARSFVFIGGDPLLRDDFVELLDHVTGRHECRARFFFNSHMDQDLAAELSRAGRGLLRPLASIDGPRPVNDGLRGAGSYDEVMASIHNLLAVGLEPVANTVLVRPALPGLAQLARELRAAGVGRLHLILPHQAGGAGGDPPLGTAAGAGLIPTGAELLAALRELLAAAEDVGLVVDNVPSWRRRVGARNDLCAAGCHDLAIDPYGRVHACVITAGDPAFVAGSLREQPLDRIWRTSSSLRLLRAARARDRAECAACPVVDACGGECWVQAHYAARARRRPAGYAAPFPYCDLIRPVLEALAADAGEASAAAIGADRHVTGACGQASAGADDYALFDCI